MLILTLLYFMTLCPIMPRFIISVRELYDGHRRQGIDTGFGMSSQPVFNSNTAVSAIEFAKVTPGQEQGQVLAEGEADDPEAIQLEMLGDGTRQV